MASEILINVRPNQTRVAYVKNQVISDLKIEKLTSPTLVGSVYKGKVLRVLPGMQAAFVDIGLDRAAFLYVGDVRSNMDSDQRLMIDEESSEETEENMLREETPSDTAAPVEEVRAQIQDLLTEGQHLLVQVAKDPLGTKGARITTHISLPGRSLVYMPTLSHLGVSRRIQDEQEKERLRVIIEKLQPKGGVIVRTAGEGSTEESLSFDLEYLYRLWKDVQNNYDKHKAPGLIHSEMDVELRALRDLLHPDIDRVVVDDPVVHQKVVSFLTQFMPKYKHKVFTYDKKEPLFDSYDLELEISRSLERKIWLKSGGYIVIDEAEALVVVDVNTGRYVGKKDLEDTILKTNMEAAREIAHQLRIRNCGGIIIVDFIDMEREVHREKLLNLFREELERDRARTTVVSMSELGLVEMTRKRIRPSLVSTLCEPCPYCDGKGYIKQKSTVANEIFTDLEREAVHARVGKVVVHCHADLADWIYEQENETLELVEGKLHRSVVFKVEPGYHIEQYEIFTVQNS